MAAAAASSESPIAYHVWTAVSVVAAALRRKVYIDELAFKIHTNFYIILVGPAALTKTSAINLGARLLHKVDGVVFGPSSATWQSMVKNMKEGAQDVMMPGSSSGIVTHPITIHVGELGTFFKTEDSVMMDVLTELWDCRDGAFTHSTLTTGDNTVENPWINILGATTPTWIKKHIPEDMIGGGLASRIIFVYEDKKASLIAYPSRHIRPDDYHHTQGLLLEDLKRIAAMKGVYRMTDSAYEWGETWYKKHDVEGRPSHLASDRYAAYWGRRYVNIHKLAMIVAAAKRDDTIIHAEDLQEALDMLDATEPSMLKVFESIGQVDEARRINELQGFIKSYGSLTQTELWALVSNIMTQKDFVAGVRSAVESGRFKVVQKNGKPALALGITKEKAE